MYSDAHLHLDDLLNFCQGGDYQNLDTVLGQNLVFCTSSNTVDGFNFTQQFCVENNLDNAFLSFGIHPQNPDKGYLAFLEKLCVEKQISAIGEIGFDLFTSDFREALPQQKVVWREQVLLAKKYSLPIVIHSRKAMPLFFERVDVLKQLPAVIFHGWSGSILEASSFLKKGVNAFFSIGKSLLRRQKTVIAMAKDFELKRLLTETDAPFMTLKNEPFTKSADIKNVVCSFADYRKIDEQELTQKILDNFYRAFNSQATGI